MATAPQPASTPSGAPSPAYQAIPEGTVFRAIACHNPHAVRIALGIKRIETRVWSTAYRGPLLICSTVRPRLYPNGYALCVAELADCRPMVPDDEVLALVAYDHNAFAWILANTRPIAPFRVCGRQRFFDVCVPKGVAYLPQFATPLQGELFV